MRTIAVISLGEHTVQVSNIANIVDDINIHLKACLSISLFLYYYYYLAGKPVRPAAELLHTD